MAFRQLLNCRMFIGSRITGPAFKSCCNLWPSVDGDPGEGAVIRRCFNSQTAARPAPEIRFLPTGERLLETLRGMNDVRERMRIGELRPQMEGNLTAADAEKILLLSQLENVKYRLRQIEKVCISRSEFLQICGSGSDQGAEFARLLDESGTVIVLGDRVFLRPEQVMKAIQGLLPLPSTQTPSDPRLKEFQEMEKEKAAIDKEAELHARRELWCGLGFLVLQTAAFMRLTFWELTWDVMEPICFYVTSMYFMGGYAFFLRTSKEPSFEGFFQSRFSANQRRLMKLQNFDPERYNNLRKACSLTHD